MFPGGATLISDFRPKAALAPVLVMAGLGLVSRFNYLLFHSLVELFSIVVAAGMFTIAWNTRRIIDNRYLLFLGIAYLFVGALDLLHTLSYKGMGVFPSAGPNLPTQLWIAARYLEAISLLLAPLFLRRWLRPSKVLWIYSAVTAVLVAVVFSGLFPDCFVEGSGLTSFKKNSEYVISLVLVAAMAALWIRREDFERPVLRLLTLSIVFTILAELAFTFYIGVYDFSNMTGHFFKLVSFYLIYNALIATGLVSPYQLLFRNLKKSEEALAADNRKLLALQEELKEKNLHLQRINEQKNELLGITAHDIRSPLAVIHLYIQALGERIAGSGDGKSLKFIDIVEKTIESTLEMLKDLLDITSIEAGKIDLKLVDVDLGALAVKGVDAYSILAGQKNISISVEESSGLPPITADPRRVGQVLDNRLSNAGK